MVSKNKESSTHFDMNIRPSARNLKANTPQEVKFRQAIKNDEKAKEIVDKVDVVREEMLDLDEGKHDSALNSPNVVIDAETGKIRTGMGSIFNGPLEDIARQAPGPEGDHYAFVYGFMNEQSMSVGVEYKSDPQQFSFEFRTRDDGTTTYTAGDNMVTMNPDGTYTMN